MEPNDTKALKPISRLTANPARKCRVRRSVKGGNFTRFCPFAGKSRIQSGTGANRAEAIRADNPHAVMLGRHFYLRFPFFAFFPGFIKSGGNDDNRLTPALPQSSTISGTWSAPVAMTASSGIQVTPQATDSI